MQLSSSSKDTKPQVADQQAVTISTKLLAETRDAVNYAHGLASVIDKEREKVYSRICAELGAVE